MYGMTLNLMQKQGDRREQKEKEKKNDYSRND